MSGPAPAPAVLAQRLYVMAVDALSHKGRPPRSRRDAQLLIAAARLIATHPAYAPATVCNAPAPDRSGRSCDLVAEHAGAHWTYGGAGYTWAADEAPR